MANTKNGKKTVRRSKPACKRSVDSGKKIPDATIMIQGEYKQTALINLLKRPGGATLDEMNNATGWQRHSIRGMMSGVLKKKLGFSIASEKEERGRVYRIGGA